MERACEHDDFRPKTSALCNWCSFKQYCPAYGGNPDDARVAALEAGGVASVPVSLDGRVAPQ